MLNCATELCTNKFQVLDIIRGTSVDGPGFRTAIYLAGCEHNCPGCHNPQSHNPAAGKEMSLEEILEIVKEEDFDVTLTGGDPLYNPHSTFLLARAIHDAGYGIWLYTGYRFEDILEDTEKAKILPFIQTVVDGPYINEMRDVNLQFRGSSNQRIIHLKNGSPII